MVYQNAQEYDSKETEEAWRNRMKNYITELSNSSAPLVQIPIGDGLLPFEANGWIREDQPKDGSGGYSGHYSVVFLTEEDYQRREELMILEFGALGKNPEDPVLHQEVTIGNQIIKGVWSLGNHLDMSIWKSRK